MRPGALWAASGSRMGNMELRVRLFGRHFSKLLQFWGLWGPFRNRRWAKNGQKNYLRALLGAGTFIFEGKSALRKGFGKNMKK